MNDPRPIWRKGGERAKRRGEARSEATGAAGSADQVRADFAAGRQSGLRL
jgi:hypothetical protein